MYYIIYKITNIHNNKFYIGSHQTLNQNDGYFGSGIYIRRALKKYGIDSFKKEILFYLDSKEEMLAKETEVLQQYKTDRTYNLKFCAMGGNTREKYNKKKKAAYIKKLIDNPKSPIGKSGKNNHMYGQKHSQEYCKLRSKQQKQFIKEIKQDPIRYKKWRDKVVPRAIEQCKRMSEIRSKKVKAVNKTTGEVLNFKSLTECAAYFNISASSVAKILKGYSTAKRTSTSIKLNNYKLTN